MAFLFRSIFWLVTLPIRLLLFLLGVVLWIVTLPVRIVFGILRLIGIGRIFQLAALGAAGYFVYRLVSTEPEELTPASPTGPTTS